MTNTKTPQQIKNDVEKEIEELEDNLKHTDEDSQLQRLCNIQARNDLTNLKEKLSILIEYDKSIKEIIKKNYYGWLPDFKNINKIKNKELKNVLQHIKNEYEELLSKIGDGSEVTHE